MYAILGIIVNEIECLFPTYDADWNAIDASKIKKLFILLLKVFIGIILTFNYLGIDFTD